MFLFLSELAILCIVLLGMVAFNRLSKRQVFTGEDFAGTVGIGVVGGLVLWLVGALIIVPYLIYNEVPYTKESPVVPLSIEQQDIEAHVPTIYSGYVNGEFKYFYFQKMDNGAVNQQSIYGETVDVFYDAERGHPHLDTFRSDPTWGGWGYKSGKTDKAELHLPRGTEIRQYQAGG